MQISAKELESMIFEVKSGQADTPIALDEDLLETHRLDSFAFVQFLLKLEERLDLAFDYKDINRQTFKSIKSILELVSQKYGVKVVGG